jgi:hypothetical protein
MPASWTERARLWRTIALLAVLGCSFAWRWQWVDVPLERDEGEYGYFGQLLRDGGVPYADAQHMKLPGVYFVYGAAFSFFPDSATTLRTVASVAHLVATAFLYLLAQRWLSPLAALLAAAAFTVLGSGPGILGFAAKAEQFVLAFGLAGLWVSALQPASVTRAFAAGVLLGTACTMKQVGLFFLLPAAALLGEGARGGSRPPLWLALAAGTALPLAGLLALVRFWGVWEACWFWTVTYAREYGRGLGWSAGLAQLARSLRYVFADAPVLWLAAATGGGLTLAGALPRKPASLWLLLAAGLASVAFGWRFSEHYFLLLVPAAAVLTALLAEAHTPQRRWLAAAFLASAAVTAVALHWREIRTLTSEQKARLVYEENPFPEAREVGLFLRERTAPGERIAVLGSEPEIYFYAQRRAATKLVYMYPLMEVHPYARQLQESVIAELTAAKPRYAVLVHVPSSWIVRPDSERKIFTWSADWVNREYRLAGLIRIETGGPSYVYWGESAATAPRGETYLAVFERLP